MRYIKLYESYKEIESLCDTFYIRNYTINNGLVDVDGDVNISISGRGLTKMPLKFGEINGNFKCSTNRLTSLEGCPNKVFGNFDISYNRLEDMNNSPSVVDGDFTCSTNRLTSLIGCPVKVGGSFYCSDNKLKTLEGCPKIVGENFYCHSNKLLTLYGCPKTINGNFIIRGNDDLSDFNFGPSIVSGNMDIAFTNMGSIYRLFGSKEKFLDSMDYDYFRGGNKINKIRITQALKEYDLDCPNEIKGYVFV